MSVDGTSCIGATHGSANAYEETQIPVEKSHSKETIQQAQAEIVLQTALQEKAFVAWLAAAQHVACGTMTRLAAEKRTHHSPAVVTPLAVSAGGGMFPEDDDILPCGADRNGRHWLRVELSSILLKYWTALTWQLWKRRPKGVFAQATCPWRSLE